MSPLSTSIFGAKLPLSRATTPRSIPAPPPRFPPPGRRCSAARPRSALWPHHHGAARPTLSPCAPPRSFFFGSPAPPPRTAARRRRGSRCSSKAPCSSRGSSRNSWRCHSSACAQRSRHPETSLCHPWRSFGVHIGVAQGTPEQEGEWGRRCAVPSRPCSSSHAAECTS